MGEQQIVFERVLQFGRRCGVEICSTVGFTLGSAASSVIRAPQHGILCRQPYAVGCFAQRQPLDHAAGVACRVPAPIVDVEATPVTDCTPSSVRVRAMS